ncbi:3-deoxy-7-phosphoheptulonate synthase [Suttonella sp. R2A3]|uniref:3-deoxy-7-phosphoheptulonate synthase n=1 Tax=Suttonella sp. R2A3 TaxID=2908648 RepID=UPI001F223DBD|nr:3-deoxy-7-phosphoheptulonate synthase [Suttonella sp. R2A3]UJF24754.1 3-deoxy-7-phosphoheptulonate synthase [Suttonella sp. R2A3]
MTIPNHNELSNLNIAEQSRLLSPLDLIRRHPVTEAAKATILQGRETVKNILDRKDPRKLVVVGPCSIHDVDAAIDYAQQLKTLADAVADQLYIVMRVYFEKPRTTVGWKGLINDPDLNDTFDIEKGLHIARELMIKINEIGLPIGTEALDPVSPQYLGDLVSWTAIGARTAESQTHREMSSGLSTPVGFKNSTDGSLDVAINAIQSAAQPHSFLGIDAEGVTAITRSKGNAYGHVVLRGGRSGPNYDTVNVAICTERLKEHNIATNLMIDCSHANSSKDPQRQPLVFKDCIYQIIEGNDDIIGMMLESHINAGSQSLGKDLSALRYGVSITDGCIDFATTDSLLRQSCTMLKEKR